MVTQGSFFHFTPTRIVVDLPRCRKTDPRTSADAEGALNCDAQLARLLRVYEANPSGLTDQEAGALAGLREEQAHKRCGDLRHAKPHPLIEQVIIDGKPLTRMSKRGAKCMVCRATAAT